MIINIIISIIIIIIMKVKIRSIVTTTRIMVMIRIIIIIIMMITIIIIIIIMIIIITIIIMIIIIIEKITIITSSICFHLPHCNTQQRKEKTISKDYLAIDKSCVLHEWISISDNSSKMLPLGE